MAVDIGPKIGIDGEKEFREQLSNINQMLRTLNSEMKAVTSEFDDNEDSQERLEKQTDLLNRQIEAQEKKLKQLTKGYNLAKDALGDTDTKTLRWAQSVQDATADLNKMRGQLQKVEKGVEDLGDAADDSTDAFGGLKDIGKSLVTGFAVGTVIEGIKNLGGAILDLEENTREYRRVLGTLEASSQAAGYSAEQTEKVYNRLNGVLGDSQAAATATANLQAIGLNQEELMELTDLAIGAWAKYGDSIPIDSMAEAITLGAQQSEITSGLADALEWAGVNIDEFKTELEAANSTEERARLIMEALSEQGLAELSESWRTVNADIVAMNEAEGKLEEQWARFGEMVAPAIAALKTGLGGALESVLDLFESAIEWGSNFFGKLAEWGRNAPTLGELIGWSDPKVDGSHALGLSYVPWDGYIAELHKGEMVLTSAQADALKSYMASGVRADNSGLTNLGAGIVNGIQTAMSGMNGGGSYSFNLVLPSGEVLARYQLPSLIDYARSSGTPILNPSTG